MPNQISRPSTSPTAMQLACISVLYVCTVDDSRCAEWISASAVSAVFPADGSWSAHGTAPAKIDGATRRPRPHRLLIVRPVRAAARRTGKPSWAVRTAIDISIVPEAFDTGRAVAQLAQYGRSGLCVSVTQLHAVGTTEESSR